SELAIRLPERSLDHCRPPLHIGEPLIIEDTGNLLTAEIAPPPVIVKSHPLDRADDNGRSFAVENQRIRMAWAKLVWLLSFLGVLLAISYLVPYIAEQT